MSKQGRLIESDEARVNVLAAYNGERGRGLLHDPNWVAYMVNEQHWFDNEYMPASWIRMGYELVPDSGPLRMYRKVKRDPFWKRLHWGKP